MPASDNAQKHQMLVNDCSSKMSDAFLGAVPSSKNKMTLSLPSQVNILT